MPDELSQWLDRTIVALDREAKEIAREAGNILLRHAREQAPRGLSYAGGEPQKKTGRAKQTLRSSLHRTAVEQLGPHTYSVGVEEGEGSRTEWEHKTVGFLVESGTTRHDIPPRDPKGVLAWVAGSPRAGKKSLGTTTPGGSLRRKRGVGVVPGPPSTRRRATFAKGISKTGRAKQTRNQDFASLLITKRVDHPGTQPNPFMDRAVSAAEPEIDAMIAERLNRVG